MSLAVVQGPLNRSKIDSVTNKDQDHRDLWNTTNTTLSNHQATIASQAAQIALLAAAVEKLSGSNPLT